MNSHNNALLTPKGRESMVPAVVDDGQSVATAARLYRTTPKTVAKWVARLRAEGIDGLRDHSSRPHSSPSQTSSTTCAAIEALRRQRHTGKQIAGEVGVCPATVSRVLRRLGLNSLKALEPAEPVRRYERAHPGEMIHLDIKKLGRFEQIGHGITGDRRGRSNRRARGEGLGWEFVHVCIDDASRVAFSQILPDEKAASAVLFLKTAVAYYAGLGVAVTRVMTDNGSCCRASHRRAEELPTWLHRYNWHRPHAGIKVTDAYQQTSSRRGQPPEAPQSFHLNSLVYPRPPAGLAMNRSCELEAGGAGAGGEVEAFAVEADRPPNPAARTLLPGETGQGVISSGVDGLDEARLGFRQRRLALAGAEDVGGLKRVGAAEAAVEMHRPDREPVKGEIDKVGVKLGLGIALEIARPRALGVCPLDPAAQRNARMVQGIASLGLLGQEERRAGIVHQMPRVAGERRHQEEGRAVKIARDSDQRGQRRPRFRLEGCERAEAGKPHQAFRVGDRRGVLGLWIEGRFRHG